MKTVTVDDVLALNPCSTYTRGKLAELWGAREAITCREYSELPVPADDRLWGMIRLWPKAVPTWLDVIVERAIRRSLGKSGNPLWETWAENWLSGEDRTRESAEAAWAAEAAEAEAWAAREAAWAEAAWAAEAWAAEAEQQVIDFVEIAERIYGQLKDDR